MRVTISCRYCIAFVVMLLFSSFLNPWGDYFDWANCVNWACLLPERAMFMSSAVLVTLRFKRSASIHVFMFLTIHVCMFYLFLYVLCAFCAFLCFCVHYVFWCVLYVWAKLPEIKTWWWWWFVLLASRMRCRMDHWASAYAGKRLADYTMAIIWTASRWTSSTILVCCLVRL